ncbi:MAG: pantoate--beta-alanine ligase [Leptospiraceae bacterium]|nr:pantoate--beta-alanine ligase [Leptospiraceae bacterium]MCK6381296.1 pantoate--beta-alanine ligase [Leptospiraceae bacterium]NUM40913.1 pantoate--beta-alanine ligase [Leptospiraceae bacterium]
MEIARTERELKQSILKEKSLGKKIGYVPTMGFLHEGHLSIVRNSKKKTDCTVVSIFVNPAQFNDPNDFTNYPKNEIEDLKKCEIEKVDLVYLPSTEELYPDGIPEIEIRIPNLMKNLCAKSRPGHFEGVMLVLSRLFHSIEPNIAFFGKKDYQQYILVKEFVRMLNFPIDIIGVDTLRESDGLAMSSRNARLNSTEREAASVIYRALKIAESEIGKGEKDSSVLVEIIRDVISSSPLLKEDYIEIVDPTNLSIIKKIEKSALIAIAVFFGKVRLIDNWLIQL